MSATKKQKPETHAFEAEVQELLGLVIHSLYTEQEIFLRELISNASDALDKRRIAALTDKALLPEDEVLAIDLTLDAEARTLAIADNGIGMSHDELIENLGTIARSGTRAFLERLREAGQEGAGQLIGQFGVGFYASFMVADEVVVTTRAAGSDVAHVWRSRADGTFTVEPGARDSVGTTVQLHLKPLSVVKEGVVKEGQAGADDPQKDYTDPYVVEDIVKRHANYVDHPIRMARERWEIERDEEGKPVEGGERKQVTEVETLNARTPLWEQPKREVTEDAARDFYRQITHAMDEPLHAVHVVTEVPVDVKALLFIPTERPQHFLRTPELSSKLALYVKRVLIMPSCEDLLPPWLRFVRGVVASDDLPLNVSRQTLQAHGMTRRIHSMLVGKVLSALETLRDDDRPRYETFFAAFGSTLKEGIAMGAEGAERLRALCLFRGALEEGRKAGGRMTLDEYVEEMKDDQEHIYYLTGADEDTLARSPHLESCRAKGWNVLLLGDGVDEWVVQGLSEYNGKPLKALSQGEAAAEDEEARTAREAKESEHEDLLSDMASVLEAHVSSVRYSSRLADSPAVLVAEEGAMGPAMERMLKEMQADYAGAKRILELNPDHPVVLRLHALHAEDPKAEAFLDLTHLLHGQARLAEGGAPAEPLAFAERLARWLGRDN